MRCAIGTDVELDYMLSQSALVLDLETTGLNPRKDTILEVSLSTPGSDIGLVFKPDVLRRLVDYNGTLVGHNIINFDRAMMHPYGVHMYPERVFDTMLVHHLWNENLPHSLDSIITDLFGDDYKTRFWETYKTYEEAPPEARVEYAAKDTIYTGRLFSILNDAITSGDISSSLVGHVHRLAFALADTSYRGAKIDLSYFAELGAGLKQRLEQLGPEMRASADLAIKAVETSRWLRELDKRKTEKGRAGVPRPVFNFDSPQQLGELLYTELGLPKQFKKRKVTTDFDALEAIKDRHPLVALIQEQREKSKLYGTYIEGMTDLLEGDRVYPQLHVNGTVTGRISHSNPNVGNLPREGGLRGMYIPEPGMVLISADFSQLEVCIAAHITRDPALLSIILEGRSQHDITAAGLGIPRQLAKSINFAMQYGASAHKIAQVLGTSVAEGELAYNKYWETYSGVRREMDLCAKCVDEGIPIVTLTGRKRHFEKMPRPPWDKAYRQAWNAKVQGTGADFTSIAFYRTHEALVERGLGYGWWTVHDELLISAYRDKAEEAETLMLRVMSSIGDEYGLTVPLKAESSGPMPRWLD